MSSEPGMDPADATAALDAAGASRVELARDLRLPRGYHAASLAIWMLTAVGWAIWSAYPYDNEPSRLAFYSMLVAASGIGFWQMRQFRAVNGISLWVMTLRRGRTALANILAGLAAGGALFGAMEAGRTGQWWLAVLCGLVAGASWVLATWWWMRLYRAEQGALAA